MKITVTQVEQMAAALAPFIGPIGAFVVPAETAVNAIVGAFQGSGVLTDDEADADLQALVVEVLTYKAEARRDAADNEEKK
jgi:hypothetical protein